MRCAFATQPVLVVKKRLPLTRFAMQTPSSWDHSSALSRRTFLLTGIGCIASFANPTPSHSYSSPYRPNQGVEKPLPGRLYETDENKVVTTPSGLQYFDILPGTGNQANVGDTVFVYYTSRLRGLYGIKIQSSYDDPASPPFIFKVGDKQVVPGISEAVEGMKVGGKRRAVLPPQIAYASPDMKPPVTEFFARRRLLSVLETNRDATIVFDLELVNVK